MGIAYVLALFLILVGLKNEELYGKEAAIWGGLSLVTLVGYLLLPNYWALAVVPQVLIDVVLLFNVFGGDIAIR
jgi:hypothetical protein